jgi:cephalosporin hydroxylase
MDAKIIDDFHRLWHDSIDGTWHKCTYKGVKTLKCPLDMWVYQELIHKHKPQLIIETGTCFGGSAYFMADQLRQGKVVTIDINPPRTKFKHPRIEFWQGKSTSPAILAKARSAARGKRVMVVLDSDHSKANVLAELKAYAPLCNTYLIVEDTDLGEIVRPDHGPGPLAAVKEFFNRCPESRRFVIDKGCEKYLMTFNRSGYLRYNGSR